MKKPTQEQWMSAVQVDREVAWDKSMDEAYARYMAQSEAYLFEDNYEPFEKVSQPFESRFLKHVNRS